MSTLSSEERRKLLQEEIYPKLQAEVVEALVLVDENMPRDQWVFMSALLMLLSSLQMKDEARTGATFVLKQFAEVNGLDWTGFMKAATSTIRESDPRLKADNEETKEETK